MKDYIEIHENFKNWKYRSSPREVTAFLFLALNAVPIEGKFIVKSSKKRIANETGLSGKQVMTALKNLEKNRDINVSIQDGSSLIEIASELVRF